MSVSNKITQNSITPEQFLIVIKLVLDYIGPEKFTDIIKGENLSELEQADETPDDILKKINQFQE